MPNYARSFINTLNRVSLGLLLSAVLTGCFATASPRFDVLLTNVERPADAAQQYGPIQLHATEDGTVKKYSFSDNLIEAIWLADREGMNLVLTNKTSYSIKVPWDEAAFVTTSGTTLRVIHAGVRLMDKAAPQAPSVIVRGGKLTDRIVPADNIYFVSGRYGGWRTRPLITSAGTVQVLLPLNVEGTTLEYVFVFNAVAPMSTSKP